MQLTDTIAFDGLRRTEDGYLVATARVARAGIQIYAGSEVGKPDLAQVRVYRPEAEVFSRDALHSFAHRPVTIDHPSEQVTAANWRDYAVGQTGDEVARDGESIRVPLVLMDAKAIRTVERGKRQLSMGYTCDVAFEPGTTPAGEQYDAIQRNIRGNHLAVVSAARGGPELNLGDDEREIEMADPVKTRSVLVDGLSVETTDQGAQALDKVIKDRDDAKKALSDALAAHAAAVKAKDEQIGALTADKKKLEDAAPKPADLDRMVADRVTLVTTARAIVADLKPDGLTDAAIRKSVVQKKLGDDIVKDASDDMIAGMFKALAKDVRPSDPLVDALSDPQRLDDAATIQAKRRKAMSDAWQTPARAA